MTWFGIGDEEWCDPRFEKVGLDGRGLDDAAGSFCMGQIRGRSDSDVPVEWFIPATRRAWAAQRDAESLKNLSPRDCGKRLPLGFTFAWLQPCNTTDTARKTKKDNKQKQDTFRSKRQQ